ncbi:MAG: hypothetical protein IT361_16280 [Gemmatimonadaceae bacterium]|nr:hypothetical protein [Gemmatimonadaceae bacterium]
MAKRRVAPRARARIALVLIGFVVVASIVVARRTVGATRARALHSLDRQRATLVSERAKLVADVGSAKSLARLQPLVERRLGLHRPDPSRIFQLPKPVTRRGQS